MLAPQPIWLDGSTSGDIAELRAGSVVVAGNFDGVHRGHQALFARAREEARSRGLTPVALTFDPHPRFVLGATPPDLLTSTERRVELIGRLGMTHVFIRRFDLEFARWTADRFVETLVVGALHAKVVIAGENFRFGARRAGDGALLASLGPSLGFESFTLEASDEKGPLSSSRARDSLLAGDVRDAAHVLGRSHSIEGIVEKGEQRGRTIGFPTANLGETTELVPPHGVYAVVVDRRGPDGLSALARGVVNIGVRPTVSGEKKRTIEAHLFDFHADLYGARLRLSFVERLRDERRFDGLEALKAQIGKDVVAARAATGDISPDPATGTFS